MIRIQKLLNASLQMVSPMVPMTFNDNRTDDSSKVRDSIFRGYLQSAALVWSDLATRFLSSLYLGTRKKRRKGNTTNDFSLAVIPLCLPYIPMAHCALILSIPTFVPNPSRVFCCLCLPVPCFIIPTRQWPYVLIHAHLTSLFLVVSWTWAEWHIS